MIKEEILGILLVIEEYRGVGMLAGPRRLGVSAWGREVEMLSQEEMYSVECKESNFEGDNGGHLGGRREETRCGRSPPVVFCCLTHTAYLLSRMVKTHAGTLRTHSELMNADDTRGLQG